MDAVPTDPPSHPPAGVAVAALAGARHVATLQRHLGQLRGAYDHGNRRLFYDELVTAYLLAFFNPTLRSLRAIADAGTFDAERLDAERLDAAGQPLHLRKLCRSTMSDAARRGCSTRGCARAPHSPVAREGPRPQTPRRPSWRHCSTTCSSSTARCSPRPRTWPGRCATGRAAARRARLDLRLDGATRLPVRICVSGRGESEPSRGREAIEPGTIYVSDRGFENFAYVNAVLDANANADVVARVKTTLNFTPLATTSRSTPTMPPRAC